MNGDGFLHRYFLNNGHKRLNKWIHYFDIYERHFERFRGTAPVMLEIGALGGGSLAMWKDYLGPESLNPECKQHEDDGIEIFIGSQDDPVLLSDIKHRYPEIDIILDDGSHLMQHMISSFSFLSDHLKSNGVYMVEDTHICYWDEYEGGLKWQGSFMEFTKDRLDEINAVHTRGAFACSEFTKATPSVSVNDSVVVFERRPQGARQAPMTGAM